MRPLLALALPNSVFLRDQPVERAHAQRCYLCGVPEGSAVAGLVTKNRVESRATFAGSLRRSAVAVENHCRVESDATFAGSLKGAR